MQAGAVQAEETARAAEKDRAPGPLSAREVLGGPHGIPGGFVRGCLDRAVASPWPDLDRLTGGFRPGQLAVVAGRPSVGKSGLALDVAAAAARAGRPAALFSLEMPAAEVLWRLLCAEAGVDPAELRRADPCPWELFRGGEACERIAELPLHIDDRAGPALADLRDGCRRLQAGPGLDLAVVDCLQLVAPEGRSGPAGEVPALLRGLKLLARELDVAAIAVSHLRRAPEGSGGDAPPELEDLPGCGAVGLHADLVCLLHRPGAGDPRPERQRQAELIVAKQRSGPTGTVKLAFQMPIASFSRAGRRSTPVEERGIEIEDGPWAAMPGSGGPREH